MGLFSRNKGEIELKNAIEINSVDTSTVVRPFNFNFFKKGKLDFAKLILYIILEKLFNGLKNLTWTSTKIQYTAEDVVQFIDRNSELLINSYFKLGYAVIMYDKAGYLRLPYYNELKVDSNGMVVNRNAVVIYSDPYIIERKTHYSLAFPFLNDINDNLNNSNYVTNQQGLMGILSSSSIPLSPASKAELQSKLKKDYGWNDDQYKFILSNADVNWTPLEIPIDKLKFDEKTTSDFKWICNLFGINPDFFLGGSTFSNQADATINFYRTAIQPLAEVLLKLARATFIAINNDLEPSTIITYNMSNIPELSSTLTTKCEERTTYLDYLIKLQSTGIDVSGELKKLQNELKDMLADV